MTNVEIIEQLENAIELIKQDGKDWLDDRDIPILEACIKSLTALDDIRSEIEGLDGKYVIGDYATYGEYSPKYVQLMEVLQIIDKYKGESENKKV